MITDIFFAVTILALTALLYRNQLICARHEEGCPLSPQQSKTADPLNNPRVYWAVAGLLFLIAVLVRAVQLGSIPYGINQDEAMAMVEAKALGDYGTDRFGMFLPVYFTAWDFAQMNVLESYLSIPFVRIFGLNEAAIRLPMLLCSLGGLVLFFFFTTGFLGKKAGLTALFVLTINPWHIMQSRWALEANLLPHFCLLGIFLLYKGLEKPRYLYFSMVAFGLAMYAYGIAWYAIPLLLLCLCIYLLISKQVKWDKALLCAGIYLAIASPIFGVMIINAFGLNTVQTPLFTMPFFPNTIRRAHLFFYTPLKEMPAQMLKNLEALGRLLFQQDDLPWNTLPGYGTLYTQAAPFIFIGLAGLIAAVRREQDKRRRSGYVITLIWLIAAVFSALMVNEANVNQSNILLYPLIITCCLGLILFLRFLPQSRKPLVPLMFVAMSCLFGLFCLDYFAMASPTFFPGFGQAIRQAEASDYQTLVITDSGGTAEILTLFYAELDAQYFQGRKDAQKEDGTPLLPYNERYRYYDFASRPDVLGRSDTLYLISVWDMDYFDPEVYEITWYDYYGLAVARL